MLAIAISLVVAAAFAAEWSRLSFSSLLPWAYTGFALPSYRQGYVWGWGHSFNLDSKMDNYQDETYGERIAGVYDDRYTGVSEALLSTLHELAHSGRALELGVNEVRLDVSQIDPVDHLINPTTL